MGSYDKYGEHINIDWEIVYLYIQHLLTEMRAMYNQPTYAIGKYGHNYTSESRLRNKGNLWVWDLEPGLNVTYYMGDSR